MNDRALWRIEGQQGKLRCGPLKAIAECGLDAIAFHPTAWQGKKIAPNSMEVLSARRTSVAISELYVRGSDLFAEYAPEVDRVYRQVYWRATETQFAAVQIELVVSVRTDLLDSQPHWPIRSSVGGAELLHAGQLDAKAFHEVCGQQLQFSCQDSAEHLFIFRQPKLGMSYAEMVHPSDFFAAECDGGEMRVRHDLFPERLEKGVIRRGRICSWFLPGEDDLARAVELARQFVAEPLPLTA
jgi:hypothetical protein